MSEHTSCKRVLLNAAVLVLAVGVHGVSTSSEPRVRRESRLLSSAIEKESPSSSLPQHEIGEIVEVYEPTLDNDYSAYAFPAQIKDIQYEDDGETISSYDVLPGFGLETLSSISPSAILPLKHLQYGTSAMCDFGALKSTHDGVGGTEYKDRLIPCTVLGISQGSEHEGNGGWYSVRYDDEEVQEVQFSMRSRSKILRFVHGGNGASNSQDLSEFRDSIVEPAFNVGDIVEIYDPSHTSTFAFPATVTAFNHHPGDSAYKYDLVNGISKTIMQSVDEHMIHAFEAQEEGSISSCNVAAASSPTSHDIFLVSCTIVSHSDDEQNYEVILNPDRKPSLRSTARREESISISYLSVQRTVSLDDSA